MTNYLSPAGAVLGTSAAEDLYRLTPISWEPLQELSYEEWSAIGGTLVSIASGINWWIGDWLNYGERNFGEDASQLFDIFGWEYSKVSQVKWVAKTFMSTTRVVNISWSHHREVAGIEDIEQRTKWLEKAATEQWSKRQLQEAIAGTEEAMNRTFNNTLYPASKNGNSVEDGLQFQDFVVEQFAKWGFYIQVFSSRQYQYSRGESMQRTEIKLDRRCIETGRLSIEVQERTRLDGPWVASGICREDNTVFYIQGCDQVLYLFDRKVLLRHYQTKLKGAFEESPQVNATVRKFYIPFLVADIMCIAKLVPGENT